MTCPPTIRVSTVASRNMRIRKNEDGRIEFSGLQGKTLDVILKALKAEFTLVIAEDGEWGRQLSNGTWTGMIGKIQKDEADIAFNEIIINEERSRVVDFSKTYTTDEMTFAIEKPEAVPTAMALIHCFDSTTWILTFITVLLMPLFIKRVCKTKDTYIRILINLLGSMLGQSERDKAEMHYPLKYKILMYFWWIFAAVWSFSYSAVLFSILSLPSETATVRNFEDLSTAVAEGKYKCHVLKGSATLGALLYNDKNYLQNLGQTVFHNKWYVNNEPLTRNRQIGKRSALVGSKNELRMVSGPENWKHHYLSEDSIMQYRAAIAMKKGYCRKERFNTLIDRFNSAGLFLKILNDHHFSSWLTASDMRRIVVQEARPLSLSTLKGAFGLLLLGLTASLVAFIIEIVCYRLKNCKMKS